MFTRDDKESSSHPIRSSKKSLFVKMSKVHRVIDEDDLDNDQLNIEIPTIVTNANIEDNSPKIDIKIETLVETKGTSTDSDNLIQNIEPKTCHKISQLDFKFSQESSSFEDKSQSTIICQDASQDDTEKNDEHLDDFINIAQNTESKDLDKDRVQDSKSSSNGDSETEIAPISDRLSMSSFDNQGVVDSITESMFENCSVDSTSIINCTVDIYSEDIEYIDE